MSTAEGADKTGFTNNTSTAYYRVSTRNLVVTDEIHADDATTAIADREEFVPSTDMIDATNLHVSAARRVFEKGGASSSSPPN
jgi:hypothetical protein